MAKERSRRLVAVDMANGKTYIGELVEYYNREPTHRLEKVIVVPTRAHHEWKAEGTHGYQEDIITFYKETYKRIADPDNLQLKNIPFNKNLAVATWPLD